MNSELKEISVVVDQLRAERFEISRLELELKKAQERARFLEEVTVPELMEKAGLDSLRTSSGFEVELLVEPKATITVEKSEAACDWLERNGHGGMIKRNIVVSFNRDQEREAMKLVEALEDDYPAVKQEKKVHPSTLLAWVRGQLSEGAELPMDLFGVYFVKRVKIK